VPDVILSYENGGLSDREIKTVQWSNNLFLSQLFEVPSGRSYCLPIAASISDFSFQLMEL